MHKVLGPNPVPKSKNHSEVSNTKASIPNLAEGTADRDSCSHPACPCNVTQWFIFPFLKGTWQHLVRVKVAHIVPSKRHPGAWIVRPELGGKGDSYKYYDRHKWQLSVSLAVTASGAYGVRQGHRDQQSWDRHKDGSPGVCFY